MSSGAYVDTGQCTVYRQKVKGHHFQVVKDLFYTFVTLILVVKTDDILIRFQSNSYLVLTNKKKKWWTTAVFGCPNHLAAAQFRLSPS